MSPHEETWTVRENSDGQVFVMCGEQVIGEVDGDFPEPATCRAKLAAQAPAMARALLRVIEDERRELSSGGRTFLQAGDLEQILREAGVIP